MACRGIASEKQEEEVDRAEGGSGEDRRKLGGRGGGGFLDVLFDLKGFRIAFDGDYIF